MALRIQIMDMLPPARPLDAQMSNLPGQQDSPRLPLTSPAEDPVTSRRHHPKEEP